MSSILEPSRAILRFDRLRVKPATIRPARPEGRDETGGHRMSAILIAGCGDVGGELAKRLLADGHEVYGLRRRTRLLPEGVRPVQGDLRDPDRLRALPGGLDVLCYTAAAGGRSPDAYRGAYVDGIRKPAPRRLAREPPRAGALRLQHPGPIHRATAIGWTKTPPPGTATSTRGSCWKARRRWERCRPTSVVVRFAGIYGPGRTRLIDRVRAGRPCAAEHYTNRIHRDDCAGVLRHLMLLEHPAPLYLGTDHEPATQCEVTEWIAGRLGLPPRVRTGTSSPPSGKRCRNARLISSGYAFEHPSFREGYRAMLAGLPRG